MQPAAARQPLRAGKAQRRVRDIDLPPEGGAWRPILAWRAGERERTGVILATRGAKVRRIGNVAKAKAHAFDTALAQGARLAALKPLPDRPVDRSQMLTLGGSMQPHVWTISGAVRGQHQPITAHSRERVVLSLHSMPVWAHLPSPPAAMIGNVRQTLKRS